MKVRFDCGCTVQVHDPHIGPVSLRYCLTHEAAPGLRTACKSARELCITVLGEVRAENVRNQAEEVFEQAEAALSLDRGDAEEGPP